MVSGPRLEAMQEGGGAFGMRGCGKDRPLVVAQNGQPIGDIGGVIVANLGRELQIGAQKRRPEFGDKLLDSVAFVAEALAAEIAVQTLLVSRPVRRFVRQRRVVGSRRRGKSRRAASEYGPVFVP